MKIVAKRRAFFKGEIIKIGQILEIKGNSIPVWAKRIGKEQKAETETNTVEDDKNEQEVKQITLDGQEENKTETDATSETEQKAETETATVEDDEFAGKSDEEILAILDELITKGIEKNIMLDDVENKTPVQQIIELRELLKEEK